MDIIEKGLITSTISQILAETILTLRNMTVILFKFKDMLDDYLKGEYTYLNNIDILKKLAV